VADLVTVTIRVSSPLRDFCGGESELRLPAATVRDVLGELERSHPKLYRAICDDAGRVRPHVNVFVNELHMVERSGLDTRLAPGDEVTLLPAVSGG
jgi:MoaD family protein